jgi:DNA-binding PadR family transcriptional regulator
MALTHLLLGFLNTTPLSGYDLNKAFSTTVQHFWTTDQSQIYRTLHKMEAEGWVRIEQIIQTDNPNKKVYHITEAGQAALRDWLRMPLPEQPTRIEWLGQLFFGDAVDNAALIRVLEHYLDGLRQSQRALEELGYTLPSREEWAGLPRAFRLQLLSLDYGVEVHRCEIRWLEQAIARLRETNEGQSP